MTAGGPVLLAWLCLAVACSDPPAQEPVVARVGGRAITVEDYDRMAAKLLAGPSKGLDASDPAARRELLEAMISKELLLQEAGRRGLDRDDDLVAQLEDEEEKRTLRALHQMVVGEPAEPEEVDMQLYFYEEGFDEEVRVAHVMCATRAAAEQVLADLAAGASFEALAAERSTHRYSAWRGGDVGFVSSWYMLPELREVLLQLKPGQIHPEPVESSRGFHVFRALERRVVTFDERREQVSRALLAKQRAARIVTYSDSLTTARGLRCEGGGEGSDIVESVCQWDGGRLSGADLAAARGQADIDQSALRAAAARHIMLAEARQRGCDRQKQVREPLRRRREELLVEAVHQQVTEDVRATEDDLRSFYDSHATEYGPRPIVDIQEILTETQELAQDLRQRLEAGASMDELAARYHTREATRERAGRMRLSTRRNPVLGALAPMALDGEVGALYGPLEVPGGYSVFRVEAREQTPGQSFDDALPRLARVVLLKLRNEAMDRLLDTLRVEHADQVEVNDEALGQVLRHYAAGSLGAEEAADDGVLVQREL